MSAIIEVENLSKRFWIGKSRESGARHLVERAIRQPLSIFEKTHRQEFWALKELNFALEPGQKLGIVGRNGAGKSTLLKLLSRISLPTAGTITLRGRVGSLLEVGTGFHPELTGRENIFLNGALLGMSRSEIARKFEAIVEFAEVTEFLDTAVKHYSSGMYVRLAFAVAAHLETEVLIVDEVLAVGDSRFQKKCIEKMNEAGRQGRTVLFVSHNPSLVQSVCTHALLLEDGRQRAFGRVEDVLAVYQKTTAAQTDADGWVDLAGQARTQSQGKILRRAKLEQEKENFRLTLQTQLPDNARRELNVRLKVMTPLGGTLFTLSSLYQHKAADAKTENWQAQVTWPAPPLRQGVYSIALELYSRDTLIDEVPSALLWEYAGAPTGHSYALPADFGPMIVPAQWQSKD